MKLTFSFFLILTSLHADWTLPPTDLSASFSTILIDNIYFASTFDEENNGLVIWNSNTGSTESLKYSSWKNDMAPGPIDTLIDGTISSSNLIPVDLASDGLGNSTALWIVRSGSTDFSAQAAVWDGTSWSSVQTLLEITNGNALDEPRIASNSSGNTISGWIEPEAFPTVLGKIHTSINLEPSEVAAFEQGKTYENLQVAIDNEGNAVAIWGAYTSNSSTRQLVGSYKPSGGNWSSEPIVLVNGDVTSVFITAKIGFSQDNVIITYNLEEGSNQQVFAILWDTSSPTPTPVPISSVITNPDSLKFGNNSFSSNEKGEAVVVWKRSSSSDSEIQARRFNGFNWGNEQTIASLDSPTSSVPIATINNDGEALVAYVEGSFDGTSPQKIFTSLSETSTWTVQTPEIIENTDSTPILLNIGIFLNGSNNAFTIFYNGEETGVNAQEGLIQAARGDFPELDPSAPSNFRGETSKNVFLTQVNIINKLFWDASTDPFVIGYRIYHAGGILAQLPVSTLSYTINNRRQGPNSYSLVAFTAEGFESEPVILVLQ